MNLKTQNENNSDEMVEKQKSSVKLFEILRIVLSIIGFFLIYSLRLTHEKQIIYALIFIIIPISGLTGIESLFFPKASALLKGRKTGSPYQTQSGINNISVAITAIMALCFQLGEMAYVTITVVLSIFLVLSSLNHLKEIIIDKRHNINQYSRPVLTLAFVIGLYPIVIQYIIK